jgi:hypothetical protein
MSLHDYIITKYYDQKHFITIFGIHFWTNVIFSHLNLNYITLEIKFHCEFSKLDFSTNMVLEFIPKIKNNNLI